MNASLSATALRKFHGRQESSCCLSASERFVDVQKSLSLSRPCLVNAQMADAHMPPVTAGRTSAAFASSTTKVDTTEQTAQLRTSDSTIGERADPVEVALLLRCPMCFVSSTNDLTLTRNPNQGQEEDFKWQHQRNGPGTWCCIRRGRQRSCQTWKRGYLMGFVTGRQRPALDHE